jgi:5-methylcytosine-specific restriction endonuclease McrA
MNRKKKLRIWKRDNYICYLCYRDLEEFKNFMSDNNPITVDHIISKQDGGTDDASNLLTCCRQCNLEKGKKSERPWFIYK